MNALTIFDLEALIEARDFASLREETRNWPAGDLADLMEPLPAEKEAVVFRLLPRAQAAETFSNLSIERQQELLKAMAHEEVVSILNDMSDDDRTELLEELPAKVTQKLLNSLSPEERHRASQLLGYAENSVGRLMTPHFVRVRSHWTVAQALDHIRHYGTDSETLSVIYVIDEKGKLVDDLRIRQILLTTPETHISNLMDSRSFSRQISTPCLLPTQRAS
jgi:magnesium transporter